MSAPDVQMFPDLGLFEAVLGGATKWQRTLQALRTDGLLPEVAYSVGDSLTYRHTRTSALAGGPLTARRRYHLVLAPTSGAARVEVAAVADLTPLAPYSDLSDRQPFAGTGAPVEVPAGGLLVLPVSAAARVEAEPDVALVVLHVTVEGATFANK